MDLHQLETLLRGSHEIQDQIIRDTGMFTVALFAVFGPAENARLELAGTGTLVVVGGCHYILTAAHVWEESLRAADFVGITLRPNVDHRFLIDVRTIHTSGPPIPNAWGEWGPDLVFLRVPAEHLGTIEAFRVFYGLATGVQNAELNADHLEALVLMGTPYELGEFTRIHADIQITGFFVNVEATPITRGNFDYVDLEVDITAPDVPENFGGVSGGGLWRVRIHASPETGRINSVATLEGVAFYQLAINNGRRVIRCHGPETVRAAAPA